MPTYPRRLKRLLAALALATFSGWSCGGADTTEDIPVDAGSDAGADADASIDAPLPDIDGDGFLDSEDNCPGMPNEDQADLDQDAVGDACDNCPTMPNIGQENEDGDDLGDACDPRKTEYGDSFVFYDFDEDTAGMPPGWTVAQGDTNASGNWSVIDGKLVQQEITDQPTRIYLDMGDALGPVVVETIMTIDELPADDMLVPTPQVGLLAAYDNGAANAELDTGYGCFLERAIPGPQTRMRTSSFSTANSSSSPIPDWELQESGQYRLALHQQPADTSSSAIHCAASQGEIPLAEQTPILMDTSFPGPTQGQVGLQTYRAAASFDYFVIYRLGGPLP